MGNKVISSIFKKRHLKLITILVLIDTVSTMIWYMFSNVEEWNPIMNSVIQHSLVLFVITKLLLSFSAIIILSKYITKKISQVGIGIILSLYIPITILHYFVFLFLLSNLS
jgi:hypothetical protein